MRRFATRLEKNKFSFGVQKYSSIFHIQLASYSTLCKLIIGCPVLCFGVCRLHFTSGLQETRQSLSTLDTIRLVKMLLVCNWKGQTSLLVILISGIISNEYSQALSAKDNNESPLCRGAFDLYFILDRSSSVSKANFQVQTVNFVHNISGFFISPKLRISLISFATTATVDLELTGDRRQIKAGILNLKRKVPWGNTYLHLGLQKAIQQAKHLGGMSASVIIVLTDGDFSQYRQKAIDSASDARNYGASVYAVGVDDYKESDLEAIVNSPAKDYVFTADNYASLKNLVASIVRKTCIEILSAKPSQVCAGEKFQVTLSGNGFTKTENRTNIICKFQMNTTHSHVTKPLMITPNRLTCSAPKIELPGSSLVLQVSVNGISFVSSNVTVTANDCMIRTKHHKTKINKKAILIFFLLLMFLSLFLLWWFWKTLPCSKPERDLSFVAEASEPKKKKWPTVDASFYGGGGVGGVKPVRVHWGDKGATESGNKLSKPQDAKVIEGSSETSEEDKGPGCFAQLKQKILGVGSIVCNSYRHVASYRPIKGGKNKFYTSKSDSYERARSTLSSTSSQTA